MRVEEVNLYLDDMRPCPEGWVLAKTVDEAKALLLTGNVVRASLDHDLGVCPACMGGRSVDMQAMPNCNHFGTGYTLVCWMEETGNWPKEKPTVHSANPVGRAKMLAAIDRHYGARP